MASPRNAYTLGAGRRACMLKEWLLLLLIVGSVAVSASSGEDKIETLQADPCPAYEYVYPFWSRCFAPLRHYQSFHLTAGERGGLQVLSGETLLSFTGSSQALGATYHAVPYLARDPLLGVPVNTDVVLVNSETQRPLTWTFQAWFRGPVLSELPTTSTSPPAIFRFLRDSRAALACPRIAHARCEAYSLVSNTSAWSGAQLAGMVPIDRAGVTYVMPQSAASSVEPLSFLAILPRDGRGGH